MPPCLNLYATQISDAGLKELRELTNLTHLSLKRTKITDAGLKQLIALKNLKILFVEETVVTDAGLNELKKTLPNLRISRTSPHP